jgi:AcrR family transcriptional regulator
VPKVLPEYLEQRRAQILDAAAVCFSRRGFHQTTMQDICEEADLSPGAVYRYFRGKEEIIEAICTLRQQQNSAIIDEAMEKGTTLSTLDELIRFFFLDVGEEDWQNTCPLFLAIIAEAPRTDRIRSMLQSNGATIRGQFTELIRESQAKGEFNPDLDPEAIARVMVALYHGFVTQKLVDPDLDALAYTRVVQALFGGDFWHETPAEQRNNRSAAPVLRH